MRARPSTLALGALVVGSPGAGCTSEAPPEPRGVLLLTIDTLRADRLQPYGEEQPTSPELAELAEGAIVFESAQSTSSWTLPSLTSLVTSLEAATHGCDDHDKRLGNTADTLAQHLVGHGFLTAAVASQGLLGRHHGLNRGFVDYDDELVFEVGRPSSSISSDVISDKGIAWLEQIAKLEEPPPWLLWLHYFDPHAQYLEHEGISERFSGGEEFGVVVGRYKGEIAYTDKHVGRVLDALDELGLADHTTVVVTSDHGEEFKEHGRVAHGQSLHREVVEIPLIIRTPGCTPGRVSDPVSLVDVAPTLLDILGVPRLPDSQGRSLVPYLHGESLPPRPVIARLNRASVLSFDSVIDDRWRFIRHRETGEVQLYDRREDPAELENLAEKNPEKVAELERELDRRLAEAAALQERVGGSATVNVGAAELRALEDLGYVGDHE